MISLALSKSVTVQRDSVQAPAPGGGEVPARRPPAWGGRRARAAGTGRGRRGDRGAGGGSGDARSLLLPSPAHRPAAPGFPHRSLLSPRARAAAARRPVPGGRPLASPRPPGAPHQPAAAFGSAPYKAGPGGHVRPGPPAGRRGRWGGGGAGSGEEKGREPGAEEGAGGGGGGERIARRWTAEEEEGEVDGGPGAGAGELSAAEAGDCGRAGGWEPGGGGREHRGEGGASSGPGGGGGPGSALRGRPAGAGRRDGAAARAPLAGRPQPDLGGTGGYRARARPLPLLLCRVPPLPPGPGSVQEMARDEVPSCFPAGAALPPPPRLLLARSPEPLCPARRGFPRGGPPATRADHGPQSTV